MLETGVKVRVDLEHVTQAQVDLIGAAEARVDVQYLLEGSHRPERYKQVVRRSEWSRVRIMCPELG